MPMNMNMATVMTMNMTMNMNRAAKVKNMGMDKAAVKQRGRVKVTVKQQQLTTTKMGVNKTVKMGVKMLSMVSKWAACPSYRLALQLLAATQVYACSATQEYDQALTVGNSFFLQIQHKLLGGHTTHSCSLCK